MAFKGELYLGACDFHASAVAGCFQFLGLLENRLGESDVFSHGAHFRVCTESGDVRACNRCGGLFSNGIDFTPRGRATCLGSLIAPQNWQIDDRL